MVRYPYAQDKSVPMVEAVKPGGPASEVEHIQRGDVMVTVDGVTLAALDMHAASKAIVDAAQRMRQPNAQPCLVTFARAGAKGQASSPQRRTNAAGVVSDDGSRAGSPASAAPSEPEVERSETPTSTASNDKVASKSKGKGKGKQKGEASKNGTDQPKRPGCFACFGPKARRQAPPAVEAE